MAGLTFGTGLFVLAVTAFLATVVIQTIQGHYRWLWFNRHGLLRVIWRIGLFILIVSISVMVVGFLIRIMLPLLGVEMPEQGERPPIEATIIRYALGIAVVLFASAIAVRFLDRREVGSLGLGFHSRWFRQLLAGLVLGVIFVSVIVAAQAAFGALNLSISEPGERSFLGGFTVTLLLFIGVAFTEELVSRGYLLQVTAEGVGDLIFYIRQRLGHGTHIARSSELAGKWVAALLTSVPFGIGHYHNPGGTLVGAVATGFAGMLLCLAYFRTRSLWLPIGLHITWNFTMGWFYGASVSGNEFGPSLFNTTYSGPEWLTGGTFGPEGSVFAFIAMMFMVLYLWKSRTYDSTPDSIAAYPSQDKRG